MIAAQVVGCQPGSYSRQSLDEGSLFSLCMPICHYVPLIEVKDS